MSPAAATIVAELSLAGSARIVVVDRTFARAEELCADGVTGRHPRKGMIAPGSDADLVVWDPAVERTITIDELHHDGDYSPSEGWWVKGWPVTTILRGRVVVEDGQLHAEQGDGRFIPRKIDRDVLERPLF